MFDVLSIGEMIIDFMPTERGVTMDEVTGFVKAPGGAPANVAVAMAKLGGRAAFLGRFGADPFGDYLLGQLHHYGVDASTCVQTTKAKTGIAFVAVEQSGERQFHFYRDPSADMLLAPEDVQETLIEQTRIVHIGSISQLFPEAFAATIKAQELAKKHGAVTSFDVNFRLGIWRGREDEAKAKIHETAMRTDVLKVSEEELEFLTGEKDMAKGAPQLLDLGPKIVLVTLGAKGTYYATRTHAKHVPTYRVEAVDATGAGDSFMAGFLRQLSDRIQGRSLDLSLSIPEEVVEMTRYANAAGALATTKMGAIPALPTRQEVFQFLYAGRRGNRLTAKK